MRYEYWSFRSQKKLHNLYPCNIIIYGTCISYKYISNHCQTRPPVQVLPFHGFSKECTVFVLRTGGALSPKIFPKLGFLGIFIWSLQAFNLRWNACNQGIILEELSLRKVLRNVICVTLVKKRDNPQQQQCKSTHYVNTNWLFTQLTKRQSCLSLHLCQHAARLRALVLRALTLCPLRLVFFLKFFSHSAQERRTPYWQDRLKRKWWRVLLRTYCT